MREETSNKKVVKEWTTVGSNRAGEILGLGDSRARKIGGGIRMLHVPPFQLTCLTAVPPTLEVGFCLRAFMLAIPFTSFHGLFPNSSQLSALTSHPQGGFV